MAAGRAIPASRCVSRWLKFARRNDGICNVARRAWRAIAVGGAVLGVLGVVALSGSSSAAQTPARVALVGDSYAVGLGPELAKLFPIFRYEGHVGLSTAQWANHSAACGACGDWLTEFKPDVVLVSLGVNDGNAPASANY